MSLAVVQSANLNNTSGAPSVTFGTTPTNGNCLVAILIASDGPSQSISGVFWVLGSGWYPVGAEMLGGAPGGSLLAFKLCGASESTTQSPWSGFNFSNALTIWEVSGAPSTLAALSACISSNINNPDSEATSITLTDTVKIAANNLLLFQTVNQGNSANAPTVSPSGASLTQDFLNNGSSSQYPLYAGHVSLPYGTSDSITTTYGSATGFVVSSSVTISTPLPKSPALSIVQTTRTNSTTGSSGAVGLSATFGSTTATGNLLVFLLFMRYTGGAATSSLGTTLVIGAGGYVEKGVVAFTVVTGATTYTPFTSNSGQSSGTAYVVVGYEIHCAGGFPNSISAADIAVYLGYAAGSGTTTNIAGTLSGASGTTCGGWPSSKFCTADNGIAIAAGVVNGVAGDTMSAAPNNFTQDYLDTSTFPFYSGHELVSVRGMMPCFSGNWATIASTGQDWMFIWVSPGLHIPLVGNQSFSGSMIRKAFFKIVALAQLAGVLKAGEIFACFLPTLSGAAYLSFSGFLNGVQTFVKFLATASLSFIGSTKRKVTLQVASAGLTFSGLVKKKGLAKVGGALSFAGSILKKGLAKIGGALSFSGSVALVVAATAFHASMTFSGKIIKQGFTKFLPTLSFVGSVKKKVTTYSSASLSFIGHVRRTVLGVKLTAVLSFVGQMRLAINIKLTAALSFVGHTYRKVFALISTPTLSFSGSVKKKVTALVGGALTFNGRIIRKAFLKVASAALSFVGILKQFTAVKMNAALSFVGHLNFNVTLVKLLSASLTFSGKVIKKGLTTLQGMLNFAGSVRKRSSTKVGGALSFAGLIYKQGKIKVATASMSFIGHIYRLGKVNVGGALSFVGRVLKKAFSFVGGTISFIGSIRRFAKAKINAILSFIGSVAGPQKQIINAVLNFSGHTYRKVVLLPTNASLSFVGHIKRLGKIPFASAMLTFSGGIRRKAIVILKATNSFVGSIVRQGRIKVSASVSFVGHLLRRPSIFVSILPASLSFVGKTVRKGIHAPIPAVLNITGIVKTTGKILFHASVSFVGSLRYWFKINFSATLHVTGSLQKWFIQKFAATLSFSGSIRRKAFEKFQATLRFIGHLLIPNQSDIFNGIVYVDSIVNAMIEIDTTVSGIIDVDTTYTGTIEVP